MTVEFIQIRLASSGFQCDLVTLGRDRSVAVWENKHMGGFGAKLVLLDFGICVF